jgi:hypothetical protein
VYKLHTVRERDRRIHRRCCKSFRPLLLSQNPLKIFSLSLGATAKHPEVVVCLCVRACGATQGGEGAYRSARASDDVLRLCVPGSRAVK